MLTTDYFVLAIYSDDSLRATCYLLLKPRMARGRVTTGKIHATCILPTHCSSAHSSTAALMKTNRATEDGPDATSTACVPLTTLTTLTL